MVTATFAGRDQEMSTLSLRLPESLHRRLGEVAKQEGVSINQLISAAVGEKMSALLTEEYLAARALRGSRKGFLAALSNVPDVEPEVGDQLRSPANKALQRSVRKAPRR
jgi:predicted DNA-binding protein